MTMIIILGAAAALYILMLLFRCAAFALPVFVAVLVGLRLHEMGYGWFVPILAGLLTGVAILELARGVLRSPTPVGLRIAIILSFAGAAAAAGYQAGAALWHLAGLGATWQNPLAVLAGLITAWRSWRDLAAHCPSVSEPVS